MHSLRYPNSGIRAKAFMRKIGFKLRVTRLNRVELFFAFWLYFHNEGNEEEGQQCMARPPARGRLTTAKAPLQRCDRLQPGPLQGTTTRRGSSRPRARPPARGHPQGQQPPAGSTACPRCALKGRLPGSLLQGQRSRKAAPPASEVPPEGSSACRKGGCPRRRRAAPSPAQGSGDVVR
ncbi:hypothetical protein GW17_00057461 [Ensete ventricosum]|nr:hypothetical protein GW17_00057461 [Ensete ventricosum]